MQTYTHLAVGGLIGLNLFPDNHYAILTCTIGAGLPDAPLSIEAIFDTIQGRKWFSTGGPGTKRFLVKEVGHSIPLLLLAWWGVSYLEPGFVKEIVLALVYGIGSHLALDTLTHASPEFQPIQQTLMWPLPIRLSGLVGIWDYRWPGGKTELKPRWQEVVFLLLVITLIILHLIV